MRIYKNIYFDGIRVKLDFNWFFFISQTRKKLTNLYSPNC